jgi:hypothetical protein
VEQTVRHHRGTVCSQKDCGEECVVEVAYQAIQDSATERNGSCGVKDISLVMAYYENSSMLAKQYQLIRELPLDIRQHLEVVVVDDGSPENPARLDDIGCPLKVYRIEVDVRWNQDAARNIGATAREARMVACITDMDHMVPTKTWEQS